TLISPFALASGALPDGDNGSFHARLRVLLLLSGLITQPPVILLFSKVSFQRNSLIEFGRSRLTIVVDAPGKPRTMPRSVALKGDFLIGTRKFKFNSWRVAAFSTCTTNPSSLVYSRIGVRPSNVPSSTK